jgi:pimeloyl-ACP methyl ester carboxylesterase
MTEPLVLLPGMMCDARVFMPQITDLARDHAVTVAPVSGAERVEELASALLSLLPPKFALAGHSFGGIVALEILRRAPNRVSRIALMNTTPLPETPAYAATREPRIVAARSGRLAQVMHEELPPSSLAPHSDRKAIMGLVEDMADHMGVEVFVRQTRALQRRRDQQATLRQIRQPALVLTGAYDTITPVKRHEFMAELIPYAVLRVIEDAGHVPSLETPEELNELLREWLRMPLVLR